MMKKFKVSIILLLSVVFFAACSGKSSKENSVEPLSASETRGEGKYKTDLTLKVGLVDDPSQQFQGKETRTDNAWTDLYKESGIDLDVMYTATEDAYADKLSQVIMTGKYPDVFFVKENELKDYVDQGVIMDISKYLEEGYLSDQAQEYFDFDQSALESAKFDGGYYALPQLVNNAELVPSLWIRKDWLEKLNLKTPTTEEEFIEVAKAFTNEDPDGNGKNDTYGFGVNGKEIYDTYGGLAYFFNMYGAMPGEDTYIEDDNGELIWAGSLEKNMQAGLKTLNNLYKENIIPKDFMSSDRTQVESDFTSGKTGMIFGPLHAVLGTYGNALALDINSEYEVVPLPKTKENPTGKSYLPASVARYFVVSSKCENPEVLFKLFNLSVKYLTNAADLSLEDYQKYVGGEPGVYTGGALSLINYLGHPNANTDNWKVESKAIATNSDEGLSIQQKEQLESQLFFLNNWDKDKYQELSETDLSTFNTGAGFYSVFGWEKAAMSVIHNNVEEDNWMKEGYISSPTKSMTSKSANLSSFTSETLVNMVIGNTPVENYSEFIDDWHSRGGTDILTEINEWKKNNK